ncbi:hypothetical protein [Thermococcus sp.]|uniref:hypothetical protein n=1 Tax=Thermococcus sp. TaxID=35749 RepID=UPI0026277CE0|nr:hypothetical protein [Thermococcus sp.]
MRPVNEVRVYLPSDTERGENAESSREKKPPIRRERVGELNIFRECFAKQRALEGGSK